MRTPTKVTSITIESINSGFRLSPSLSERRGSTIRRTRTIPLLVLSVIALVMTLSIAPEQCKAAPITVVYVEAPNAFGLEILAGGFTFNDRHPIMLGNGSWTVTGNIVEDAGFITDVLSINIMARHIVGPHGEGPNNLGPFAFNIVVSANVFGNGNHLIPLGATFLHGAHFDVFAGSFSFTILGGDITAYRVILTGEHVIPEPATMFLLGTGLAGVAIKTRKRLKNRKSG